MTIKHEGTRIELKHPVKLADGKVLEAVTLQRLKAKHLRMLPQSLFDNIANIKMADLPPLIAAVTDLPLDTVDMIDLEDINAISPLMGDFLEQSLGTGKK